MGIHERKEREKEQRREEILQAATKVFFEKGLQVATMDEIADAAELSKGTLYLYYKSKEDLYLGVMSIGIDILYDMFLKATERTASTLETLRSFSRAFVEFFRTHRDYYRMFHFFQNPQLHKQVSDEMKEYCRTNNQKLWDLATKILQRGVDEGLLRKDLAPIEMAFLVWSTSNSIMMQIDFQQMHWRNHIGLDLDHMLEKANELLLETLLTEDARAKLERPTVA
ncbi:MAG TPA: hypothetical protein DCX46_03955 [Bacteroidetes bacterium]|nr:hypothetical protein [Bacteroidota bacterium]